MAPIFPYFHIALSGKFKDWDHAKIESYIKMYDGYVMKKIAEGTTHLIVSERDWERKSEKVKQALKLSDIKIVNLDWFVKSIEEGKKLDEEPYLLTKPVPPTGPKIANPILADAKREVVKATDAKTVDGTLAKADAEVPKVLKATTIKGNTDTVTKDNKTGNSKKRTRGGKGTTKEELIALTESPDSEAEIEDPPAKKPKEANKAKSSNIGIPIDEGCNLQGTHRVHISNDGTIYDVALNQTNAANNNNKFYRIQLLESPHGDFRTWTRWGRVGELGQSALLGSGGFDIALSEFEKKFKDKTGHRWTERLKPPKKGKYTFIERNYETDSSSDDDGLPGASNRKVDKASKSNQVDKKKVESKLSPEVQQLMELIFNQRFFAENLSEMNYDANKLPLGKLSKATLKRGYECLKELAEVIANPALADEVHNMTFNDAVIEISNSYYSYIPHNFGRNRPIIIREEHVLKQEIALLESLTDMEIANGIMKETKEDLEDPVHPLDRQYMKLGMDEMTALDSKSTEFKELSDYLIKSHGATHYLKFKVETIFRIDRSGEDDRFTKSPYSKLKTNGDRRLLWHGSRTTNFGGILSQGLRIAPPEAPVSGYMFGKGVYLADISSKSANYCQPHSSGGVGLLLLCQSELGNPMLELTNSDYNASEEARKQGRHSTWGKGMTAPVGWKDAGCVNQNLKGVKMPDTSRPPGHSGIKNAYLQYNEYICYNVEQIRLRYLFRVKMT